MNEQRISRITDILQQVTEESGKKEYTKIFPNAEVVDSAPTDLTTDYIIIQDENGFNSPALKVPGLTYTNGDKVNLLIIRGTEPIAFQHGSGSSGSNSLSYYPGPGEIIIGSTRYATLAAATAAAIESDLILLGVGTYACENVILGYRVRIRGVPGTILTVTGDNHGLTVDTARVEDLRITITRNSASATRYAGLVCKGASTLVRVVSAGSNTGAGANATGIEFQTGTASGEITVDNCQTSVDGYGLHANAPGANNIINVSAGVIRGNELDLARTTNGQFRLFGTILYNNLFTGITSQFLTGFFYSSASATNRRLQIVNGGTYVDSDIAAPNRYTARATAPTSPILGDTYLDDGTDTSTGLVGWRYYNGTDWIDLHIKYNVSASTDPTSSDDSGDGYSVGSIWINTTAGRSWICLDDSLGAAVWRSIDSNVDCVSNGRLSASSSDPTITTGLTNISEIYLLPYLGGQSSIYNDQFDTWENLDIPGAGISIKLIDSQTGTRTSGSAVITGLTNTSQFVVGMIITGLGIPGSTTILSINSLTQITLSANASSSGTDSLTMYIPADKNVDIFEFNDGGNLKLEFGTLWTNNTTRATNLTKQDGIYVKGGDPTRKYRGTVRTSANGETTLDVSTKKLYLWNYYNRLRVVSSFRDATGHTYNGTAWRQFRATTGNKFEVLVGVSEEMFEAQAIVDAMAGAADYYVASIGYDSTTAEWVSPGSRFPNFNSSFRTGVFASMRHKTEVGYHYYALIEITGGGTATITAGYFEGSIVL